MPMAYAIMDCLGNGEFSGAEILANYAWLWYLNYIIYG